MYFNHENNNIIIFYRDGPALFKFDHVYPSGKASPVTVILYAQLGTAGFKKFHNKLVELSSTGKLSYVYRHYIMVGNTFILSL